MRANNDKPIKQLTRLVACPLGEVASTERHHQAQLSCQLVNIQQQKFVEPGHLPGCDPVQPAKFQTLLQMADLDASDVGAMCRTHFELAPAQPQHSF